ncbi:hypothetical protein DD109_02665 [Clostridioides difficile]|uniref:Uncharacterized protein n=1 Tax=Clostridioides difficile (strain 630) TaxID=272563 RepID=F3Y617_CLOD6|nr:hypothetical protein CWR55_15825 [Clostridioides difficile]EQE08583.1 hypothetical protein QAU_3253 [Clostridioides difficile CD13]EQE20808.1 hypothetical protein QC1_3224 [Clostridioides difficile CD21]EQE32428.1 hypothetical protein QC7_3300 [Clostridioides difficile CD38]EQE40888.1 hypothetical protein QC9_3193 [Clostridioides difficile CD39]EQE47086.1 hypothetical protein QCE_3184 [Clostridioides difficile CD42]EQE55898.1 hypothetical protein QCI_3105 [Clostridioides difficile CD44]EQ
MDSNGGDRGEFISGYLIVLLVFISIGIWLFGHDVEAIFLVIFYCLFL